MSARHTFFCIDGHTCGNPVRVVAGGGPALAGATMSERRQHFVRDYDWIRRALMYEPRGHDLMSGAVLYPPLSADADLALLFVETTGCLPMCGHGTIGTVTIALEHGLVSPRLDGTLILDTPAGRVEARYRREGARVEAVRITNVPSFLAETGVTVQCPGLGPIAVDIAYGGNYYAIVDPQPGYAGMEAFSAAELLAMSPGLRDACNRVVECVHPDDASIAGVSHVMWTGAPQDASAHGRNAVFYGSGALDRSPCGTGVRPGWRNGRPRESSRPATSSCTRASSAASSAAASRARRRWEITTRSCRASKVGRASPGSTPSSSMRPTPSPTAFR